MIENPCSVIKWKLCGKPDEWNPKLGLPQVAKGCGILL